MKRSNDSEKCREALHHMRNITDELSSCLSLLEETHQLSFLFAAWRNKKTQQMMRCSIQTRARSQRWNKCALIFQTLTLHADGLLHQGGSKHPAAQSWRERSFNFFPLCHIRKGIFELATLQSLTSSSTAVRDSSDAGALNGGALLIHTPAEAGGSPALRGYVLALWITLRLEGTDLSSTRFCLLLALGLHCNSWKEQRKLNEPAWFEILLTDLAAASPCNNFCSKSNKAKCILTDPLL